MTKVLISRSLLNYQHAMAAAVEKARRETHIAGLQARDGQAHLQIPADAVSSEPDLAGLLQPPRIEIVIQGDLEARDGRIEDFIHFWIWSDFGPLHVCVNILDENGKLIDGGSAMPSLAYINHWLFLTEIDIAECEESRSLTVQAIVTDRLGGMGMHTVTLHRSFKLSWKRFFQKLLSPIRLTRWNGS